MRKLLIALVLAPAAAFAGGYAIPNENARSLGLVQADVAAQTDANAAYQNAAALAGLKGLSATASLEMIDNVTYWTDPTLGSAQLRTNLNFPPMLAVSYGDQLKNGMGWGAGIAFLLPAGGSIFWPTDWQGVGRIQSVDQKVFLTQVSGGFSPIPYFKVGASFLWYRITEKLEQKLNFLDTMGDAQLGLAGNAYTFGLSGQFDVPNIPLTFAVDYRHQAPVTISGAAHITGVPPSFASALQDQSATESITVPNELFLGASYDFDMGQGSDLKAMFAFTLERWIDYGSDTYVGAKGLVISVPRNYKNAQEYRFAGEWNHVPFLPPLTLRVGYERSVSPQPTDTLSPTLTDGDSKVFSAGLGFDVLPKTLRIDVGYQFVLFDWTNATGTEAFPGSYKTHVHFLSAGATFHL
jgi:long-subunit fatty acid transport protein